MNCVFSRQMLTNLSYTDVPRLCVSAIDLIERTSIFILWGLNDNLLNYNSQLSRRGAFSKALLNSGPHICAVQIRLHVWHNGKATHVVTEAT